LDRFFAILRGWVAGKWMFGKQAGREYQTPPSMALVTMVLRWVTGMSRQPPGGFKNLRNKTGAKQPFQIQRLHENPDGVCIHDTATDPSYSKVLLRCVL
jgi:hypothetical protein